MKDRRFIEASFPVRDVGLESAKEKNIRAGHISTIHKWWARKPLASSRGTNYAALVTVPHDIEEWNRTRDFIVNFSKWENSLNRVMIERARKDIIASSHGKPPRVLDPFAGGGAIPLEALRLGCRTYSSDYNPVAVLIQKCTLEYPQKYGTDGERDRDWNYLTRSPERNHLVEDIQRWNSWVFSETEREVGRYYKLSEDGTVPLGYLWARTLPCQNPACGVTIPLSRQFSLARKGSERASIYPYLEDRKVKFSIVGDGYEQMPADFDPTKGTISKAIVTCPACGSTLKADTTRKLLQMNEAGEFMLVVVSESSGRQGKSYRIATRDDLLLFREAEHHLEKRREELRLAWGLDPVPDEPIDTPDGQEYRPGGLYYKFTTILLYGMTRWGSLFNSRQKLVLITFMDKVREAYQKMLGAGTDSDYAKAIVSYLALGVDRLATGMNRLVRWRPDTLSFEKSFERQVLSMVFNYGEWNPFHQTARKKHLKSSLDAVSHCSRTSTSGATVVQASATSLPYPDNHFDAIFTDPPYYDNVPYGVLSDFYYVFLKRMIGHHYPELFSTPTTPKRDEAIAELSSLRGVRKDVAEKTLGHVKTKDDFEDILGRSFKEIRRVLKSNGIATIVYAHKSTDGWEALVNSLLDSGLVITGAWPITTELASRLRAKDSATLSSSIYIVARKMDLQSTGLYNDVKEELRRHLGKRLRRLWEEGIAGADFFIAAIGSGIEIFGKYETVIDSEGNTVRANRFLDDINKITTDYAVTQILPIGTGGEISDLTRLYVLWRWEFGEKKVLFDDAHKLAQSCGIDLSLEWNRGGFVRKEKEFIRFIGPQDRRIEDLENSHELIDALHLALRQWEKGRTDEMTTVLSEAGFGGETFFRVAQAISQTLANESKEKKLLDGFLAGRERVREEVRRKTVQTRLM